MKRAVSIDNATPIASVMANPFTVPEPSTPSTAAAISVVIFPSKIADIAFLNPVSIALATERPAAISSLIRAKIITFASTAIPIERIIPAIPGSVSVISNASNIASIRAVYKRSASDAAIPGIAYMIIRNTITIPRPIAAALREVESASEPS